ncbi:MAG: NYN domain-containing protein [Chloroflexota bacterium]|nr:MAG: NYN domain-containing protein [Chloroflexota bacterium]
MISPDPHRRTIVYIDGFNVYYGLVKDTAWKWLDIVAFCRKMLPRNEIVRVKYFTAKIQSRSDDPQAATRQETYLSALETLPDIEIHYGRFLANPTRMPLASTVPGWPGFVGGPVRTVEVMKTEEKGSDVNLATHLVVDGFEGAYDIAVVVSNDSDLTYPIEVARKLGRTVGLIAPVLAPDRRPGARKRYPSRELTQAVTPNFVRTVRPSVLARCQLPPRIHHPTTGQIITKPATW